MNRVCSKCYHSCRYDRPLIMYMSRKYICIVEVSWSAWKRLHRCYLQQLLSIGHVRRSHSFCATNLIVHLKCYHPDHYKELMRNKEKRSVSASFLIVSSECVHFEIIAFYFENHYILFWKALYFILKSSVSYGPSQ